MCKQYNPKIAFIKNDKTSCFHTSSALSQTCTRPAGLMIYCSQLVTWRGSGRACQAFWTHTPAFPACCWRRSEQKVRRDSVTAWVLQLLSLASRASRASGSLSALQRSLPLGPGQVALKVEPAWVLGPSLSRRLGFLVITCRNVGARRSRGVHSKPSLVTAGGV